MVHNEPRLPSSAVGTLFIQPPRVDTRDKQSVLLDDVIGPWFAFVCWSNNPPRQLLGGEKKAFADWKSLGAVFVALRPITQLHWTGHDDPDVIVVGDRTGALKAWFDAHEESVMFLRPDRCIAGACIAQRTSELSAALLDKLTLTPPGGGTDATGALLHVAQPAAEPTRPVGGTA